MHFFWNFYVDVQVWYAAITQCFFSLAVCFGNLIMYASFNRFDHNVYRDATIVTTLDTFTSMLAGVTIFGILGHLAHELGTDDIGKVVKGGAGLAFISYPDAIARFQFVPQVNCMDATFYAWNSISDTWLIINTILAGLLRALLFHVVCARYRK